MRHKSHTGGSLIADEGLIIRLVADEFQITVKDINGPTRRRDVTEARSAIAWILKNRYRYRDDRIGRLLRRNRCTINNMRRRAEDLMFIDEHIKLFLNKFG